MPPRKLVARLPGGNVTSTSKGSPVIVPGGIKAVTMTTAFSGEAIIFLTLVKPALRSWSSSRLRYESAGVSPPVPSNL